MSAQSRIPLTFNVTDPVRLRTDLERQSADLEAYHATLTGPPEKALLQRRFTKRPLNDTTAAFWQVTPVSLVNASDVHRISLPRPDPRNAFLALAVVRKSTAGTINLTAPNATINGFDMVEVAAAVGIYIGWFDGEHYYFPPGNVWGVP